MTPDEKKCLYSFNFWKEFMDYRFFDYSNNKYGRDIFAVFGEVIEHLCYKNSYLSEIICVIVIKTLKTMAH